MADRASAATGVVYERDFPSRRSAIGEPCWEEWGKETHSDVHTSEQLPGERLQAFSVESQLFRRRPSGEPLPTRTAQFKLVIKSAALEQCDALVSDKARALRAALSGED